MIEHLCFCWSRQSPTSYPGVSASAGQAFELACRHNTYVATHHTSHASSSHLSSWEYQLAGREEGRESDRYRGRWGEVLENSAISTGRKDASVNLRVGLRWVRAVGS